MPLTTTTPISLVGPAGSPGQGILTGQGAPAANVGVTGSFYRDLTNAFEYGPKLTDSSWSGATVISIIGPAGPPGAAGAAATIPNDLAANSLAIAPVSGDSTASTITQKNSSGTTVFSTDTSGGVQSSGSMSVAGATTFGSTVGVTGATSLAAVTASGNASVGGTLAVTGATTAAAVTASGLVTAANVTLSSGGKVTFADGTTQSTAPGSGITYDQLDIFGPVYNGSVSANAVMNMVIPSTSATLQYRVRKAGVLFGVTITGTISASTTFGAYVNRTTSGGTGSDIITPTQSNTAFTTATFAASGFTYFPATPIALAVGDMLVVKFNSTAAVTVSLGAFLHMGVTPQTT